MEITLNKTLEEKVTWKHSVPCVELTAGLPNKVDVKFRETPMADDIQVIKAASYSVALWSIPEAVTKYYEAVDIPITADSLSIPLNITLKDNMLRGYYRLAIILKDIDGVPIDLYEMYAVVDKTIKPQPDKHMRLDSIRTQMHDICASDNKLLDSLEIATGDIASAVERCLEQWNNRFPRMSVYGGNSFPYPEILRCGVISSLLESIWILLERNRMNYNSGGVSVDLERRADSFAKLVTLYQDKWIGGLCQAKNAENVLSFDQGLSYL